MSRDYKKEAAWSKAKYTRLFCSLDKSLADRFKEKLEQDNIKYSDWLRIRIKEYLGEE